MNEFEALNIWTENEKWVWRFNAEKRRKFEGEDEREEGVASIKK